LRNADLRDAFMRNTDLSGADLRNANLDGSIMENTNLAGADLTDAYITNSTLVIGMTSIPEEIKRHKPSPWLSSSLTRPKLRRKN
jgi:hypothetical protein